MLNKVKEAIEAFGLLSGVKTVAVAVSGGADSVALLSVMLALRDEYGIEVSAAHFNHKLRGEESDRDESFVRSLCKRLGVKLTVGSGNVSAYAKESRQSTELAARQMRYDFFDTLCADAVATAHTASDDLETVILNLTRGSGIDGLCGIPPRRGRFIRPLIFCTRQDIEEYCDLHGLDFVTDSTNLTDDYARNRVRHKVIPILKSINPAAETNVCKTVKSLFADRDFIDTAAMREYEARVRKSGLSVENFAALDRAVAARILRRFCTEKGVPAPDYQHVSDLLNVAVSGGRCSLGGNAEAYRQKNLLKIMSRGEKSQFRVEITRQKFIFTKKSRKVNNLLLNNLMDCDKISGEIEVRVRREGDKIRLAGRGCTKTLKQLYNENAIPQSDRENLPVIADERGVIWVAGIGVAERVAVTDNSEYVYNIVYETVYGGNNKK